MALSPPPPHSLYVCQSACLPAACVCVSLRRFYLLTCPPNGGHPPALSLRVPSMDERTKWTGGRRTWFTQPRARGTWYVEIYALEVAQLHRHSEATRAWGLSQVWAVDSVPERLRLAEEFGAQPLPLTLEGPVGELLREATGGRGADVVLEAVGSQSSVQLAYELVRPGGVLSDPFSFRYILFLRFTPPPRESGPKRIRGIQDRDDEIP